MYFFSNIKKTQGAFILLISFASSLLMLHLTNVAESGFARVPFLLGVVLPIGITASLIGGSIWIYKSGIDVKFGHRIPVWSIGTAIVLTTGAVLTVTYQQVQGVNVNDQLLILGNTASGGAVVGFIVGLYDYRTQRAQADADHLTRQVTVLNRVLRHDIRNKANIIQGHADYLIDHPSDVSNHASEIKNQAIAFVKIGDKARNIEKIIHNTDEAQEVVNIASQIETVCRGARSEYPTAEISTSLPESLPVVAHPLVDSALINVVRNAIEHNDKSQPRVTIESESVFQNGDEYIELRIADNGPGIPEHEIDVLTNNQESDLKHLSGLGLWLISWIITSAGGNVTFEENSPSGSIVCLQFQQANENG
jgi:signal transduction histidine kinase